ncbi:MAG TPA: hypothetical protein GX518_02170 [Firmicutes bacterium]|nr:hypothetical protein [Bacillota bacterium]
MISTAKFRSSSWLSAGLLIALLFGLMPPVGAAGEGSGFAGGSGTEDDPYLIATAQQLARIGDYLDAHFQLIADIDLNLSPYNLGKGWQPIGSEEEPFTGSLDGNDKTIRGLYINRPEEDNIGLFAVIGKDAILRNLRLEDVQITGKDNVGGLVGWTYLGDVENCHVSGTVAGVHKVGGLAGEATRYIRNCYTHCDVRGSEGVGGIAGVNWGTFIASYAAGTTNGREGVGGLVGHNFWFIYDCYATGPVKGEQKVGGLVGSNAEGYVYTSYASGSVTGDAETGGLVGHQGEIGMVYNSYYDRETTGQADTGKGEPRSTAELQWRANYPKWDFAEKWVIADGAGYPLLRWQEDAPRWGFKVSLPEGSAQPGVEFELELTAARGGDGEPLAASREVTVLAGAGGEVVFQGPVEFVGGEARVPLTFASPGTRHLLISMAGFPYSEPIVVEVINPEYAGGSGTLDDPYLIATARQLDHVRYNLTAAFKLLNDIDLDVPPYNEGAGWQPIGSRDRPFLGFFDGNGRSIRGLYLKREAEDDVGLFGALGDGAAVYNVKLEKVKVTGRTPTGGLAGVNEGGSIDTVEVSGTVAGFSDTGGLVGENHGYIKDCYSHCTVTGRGVDLGGLVGDNYGDVMGSSAAGIVSGVHVVGGLLGYHGGTASECSATAAVKGQDWVGGLVAQIDEGGILSRSHAGGTVAGNLYVGGLVAYNAGDIAESYSTGAVTGEKAVGGFIGYNDGAVRDAYATGAVTGSGDCGGFAGHNKGEIAIPLRPA